MKHFFKYLLVALATACASTPQVPSTSRAQVAASTTVPDRRPIFMFSVERDGLPKSFLHGSVHLLKHKEDAQSEAIDEAFKNADTLVVEVDVTAISEQTIAAHSLKLGLYPPGDDLTQHLSPARWQNIASALPKLGLDPTAVIRMKPWFLSLLIEMQSLQKDGYSADNGVDLGYLRRAHSSIEHKTIAELESAQEQLQILATIPETAQVSMLEDAIAQSDSDLFERLLSAWKQGNLAELESALFQQLQSKPESAPIYEAMFFERNRQMTKDVVELLNTGTRLFVVVGAGHLVGSQGIPALLRTEGFAVKQVTVEHPAVIAPPHYLPN